MKNLKLLLLNPKTVLCILTSITIVVYMMPIEIPLYDSWQYPVYLIIGLAFIGYVVYLVSSAVVSINERSYESEAISRMAKRELEENSTGHYVFGKIQSGNVSFSARKNIISGQVDRYIDPLDTLRLGLSYYWVKVDKLEQSLFVERA